KRDPHPRPSPTRGEGSQVVVSCLTIPSPSSRIALRSIRVRARSLRLRFIQRIDNGLGFGGANEAGDFIAVPEHDQCRPKLDAKASPERTTLAVLDLQVTGIGMTRERVSNCRLRAHAMWAPGGAEFQQRHAIQCVDFLARGFGGHVTLPHVFR